MSTPDIPAGGNLPANIREVRLAGFRYVGSIGTQKAAVKGVLD